METVDLAEVTDVVLDRGLAGFPGARRFSLVRIGDDLSPWALLRSEDVEGLEFVVVPSAVFFPDYAPVVDDDLVTELELTDAADAIVLLVVTLAEPIETSTVNLMGPIILNRHTRRAAQAILSPEDHAARAPLVPSA